MLTRLAILLPLLLTCFGCGTSYLEREHFEVNDFDINRLEVVFIKNARLQPVKLTITGAGVVELTTGSSPQLSDSFSIDTNNKEWNDIVHRRQTITRAEAVTIVNRVLERYPHKDHLLEDMIEWPDNLDTDAWYYADVQEATNSHSFDMLRDDEDEPYEVWTELLPVRDWTALEREWSEYDSSRSPGEVGSSKDAALFKD